MRQWESAREQRGTTLSGVRVLEISSRASGSILGMLLADQGAAVTKIIGGDLGSTDAVQPPSFYTWNRGKRLIWLEPDLESGTAAVTEMLGSTDVIVADDVAMGAMLGIDDATARAIRPEIIYCSLPALPGGLGIAAPEVDPLVGAMTAVHQTSHSDPAPSYNPLALPSVLAATRAAAAVTAALAARDRGSAGRSVEVSLYEAMLMAWGRHLVRLGEHEDIGVVPKLPLLRQYRCADGRYVQLHGNYETRWSRILLQVAGHSEYIDEAAKVVRSGGSDPQVQATWLRRITAYMLTRPAAEWEQLLNDAGGAAAMSRTVEEWLDHEHPREAGLVVETAGTPYGTMKQPGVAVTVSGGAVGARPDEVESRPGHRRPARGTATGPHLPLSGVRVLDLTILIAGPTCGRTLAELGAEVIKIDDPHRVPSIHSWVDANRGKSSLLLDLKAPEGREIFWRLLDSADVVVSNYRRGKLGKLGLGYEDIVRRRPNIVYASVNAYGAKGPWAGWAGWEQVVQAASGHQVRRAGRRQTPMVVTPWVCDYTAGLLAAYGVALAMHDQARGGGPRHVETSLAASAALVQSQYFFDYPGYVRKEIEGPACLGESALSRLYEARDGWLFLEASPPGAWDRLVRLPELAALAADGRFADAVGRAVHESELSAELARLISTKDKRHWIAELTRLGVPTVERRTLEDLRADSGLRERGVIVTRAHPVYGSVRYVDTQVRWSDVAAPDLGPPPAPGQNTRDVLHRAGYGDDEIARLLQREVVAEEVLSIRESGTSEVSVTGADRLPARGC